MTDESDGAAMGRGAAQSRGGRDASRKSPVPSVEKALDVLELVSEQPHGMTMNEIVESLGRTMGELYRAVQYLTHCGYLEQDPDTSRYALTLRLFELSHHHPPTARLLRNAVPLMERFAASAEQSCHIGVLSDTDVLILASVVSPRPAGYSVRTGAMFPAVRTSTGMVIVAFSNSEDSRRFLNRLPKDARATARGRLQAIRGLGYDDRPSEIVAGVHNLSVPVFDNRGIVCAITCGRIDQAGPCASREKVLELLRSAGEQLSRSLGFVGSERSHEHGRRRAAV